MKFLRKLLKKIFVTIVTKLGKTHIKKLKMIVSYKNIHKRKSYLGGNKILKKYKKIISMFCIKWINYCKSKIKFKNFNTKNKNLTSQTVHTHKNED